MTLHTMDQLIKRASKLSHSERLLLANRLIQGVRNEKAARTPRKKWMDVAGMLTYPALGEDAQAYISKSRQESDESRIRTIRDAK